MSCSISGWLCLDGVRLLSNNHGQAPSQRKKIGKETWESLFVKSTVYNCELEKCWTITKGLRMHV